MPKQGTMSGPNRARPAAIDSDLCAFAQAWQDARGERDREGEGDSKDKLRSSHACCHQQAALSRRLAMGDAAVGARGGGSGAGDGAEAQQAAEALQAGFDGGAPAPGWRARSKPRWTACWRARTRSTPASTRTRTATCPRTACGAWQEMCTPQDGP